MRFGHFASDAVSSVLPMVTHPPPPKSRISGLFGFKLLHVLLSSPHLLIRTAWCDGFHAALHLHVSTEHRGLPPLCCVGIVLSHGQQMGVRLHLTGSSSCPVNAIKAVRDPCASYSPITGGERGGRSIPCCRRSLLLLLQLLELAGLLSPPPLGS